MAQSKTGIVKRDNIEQVTRAASESCVETSEMVRVQDVPARKSGSALVGKQPCSLTPSTTVGSVGFSAHTPPRNAGCSTPTCCASAHADPAGLHAKKSPPHERRGLVSRVSVAYPRASVRVGPVPRGGVSGQCYRGLGLDPYPEMSWVSLCSGIPKVGILFPNLLDPCFVPRMLLPSPFPFSFHLSMALAIEFQERSRKSLVAPNRPPALI